MFRRFRSMTACWCRSRSKTLTWIRWPVLGNQVSTSTETKKSVEVGVAVLEPQAPFDRVVVGEGDEVHPAGLGEPVDLLGLVVGVVAVRRLEVLEDRGVGVDVEVGPREREGGRRPRCLGTESPPGVFGHGAGVSPAGGAGVKARPLLKSARMSGVLARILYALLLAGVLGAGGVDLVFPLRPRQGRGGPRPDRTVGGRCDRPRGGAGPAGRRRPVAGGVRRGGPRPAGFAARAPAPGMAVKAGQDLRVFLSLGPADRRGRPT